MVNLRQIETESLTLQVQRWAPTADRKLNVQFLIGFGSGNVGIQWEGPQAEAEAAIQASGLLNIPGLQVCSNTLFICSTLIETEARETFGLAELHSSGMWPLSCIFWLEWRARHASASLIQPCCQALEQRSI